MTIKYKDTVKIRFLAEQGEKLEDIAKMYNITKEQVKGYFPDRKFPKKKAAPKAVDPTT